jgi:hypothetical protein
MLESSLGVNRNQAIFFGVGSSIVTYSGRVVERLPTNYRGTRGYYWRSYDFLFDRAAKDALAKAVPTYAAGRSVNDLIAGEIIFSLPNGLQAYMLTGFGSQHRYDAVASVARDSRREDKLVINGESCITCHAKGLNVRKDEVRPAFERNAASFDAATLSSLRQLYPEPSVLEQVFAQDNAKFAQALKALGFSHVTIEPVGATIQIFKDDRGIKDLRRQSGETEAVFGI